MLRFWLAGCVTLSLTLCGVLPVASTAQAASRRQPMIRVTIVDGNGAQASQARYELPLPAENQTATGKFGGFSGNQETVSLKVSVRVTAPGQGPLLEYDIARWKQVAGPDKAREDIAFKGTIALPQAGSMRLGESTGTSYRPVAVNVEIVR